MTLAAGNVPRERVTGRKACAVCGAEIEQLRTGRPRSTCPRVECQRKRHRQRQNSYTSRWGPEDWPEILAAWRKRCACCGAIGPMHPVQLGSKAPPVPACGACRGNPEANERIRSFITLARPGCPVPRKF